MSNVIFICSQNAGCSQIAEAFFNRTVWSNHQATSAGCHPAQAMHPAVLEAMREVGLDIAGKKPKLLADRSRVNTELIITMGCRDEVPSVPGARQLDWEFDDLGDAPLGRVREIRDAIETRVYGLVDELDRMPAAMF